MDPDRLDQLTQEELDAWAEQCWQLEQIHDDRFDGFDDDGLLEAELAALAAEAGGERAMLLGELADTEQWQRMLQARQQQMLATLSRLSPFPDGDLPAGAEALDDDRHAIAAAALETSVLLGIAPSTAKGRLFAARELVEQHPDLHAALAGGLLDGWRAKLILDALRPLPDETAGEVEAQILAEAAGLTAGKLLDRLRRLVITADPRDAAARHAQARARRRVTTRRADDGMGQLFGELPAEDLAVVDEILDRVADALRDADPDDGRTMAQRRADALARICDDVARTGHTGGCQPGCGHPTPTDDAEQHDDTTGHADEPVPRDGDRDSVSDDSDEVVADEPAEHEDNAGPDDAGADSFSRRDEDPDGCPDEPPVLLRVRDRVGRPHIQVTVSWTTLAGLDDLPAMLAGYGPITAEQARALAADGVWRRLLTDPASGVLLDYGRDVRRPPQALQDHVRGRDVTSTFPTDNTPAHRAEIDHHLAWEDGGTTSADNCGPLSGWINRAKTWYGWSALRLDDGTLRWTSPTGMVTDRPATQIGPTDEEQGEAAARKQHYLDRLRQQPTTPEPDPPPDPDPPPF